MATDGERAAQKQYWLEHSTTPTVEAMMLDSKAAEIDLMERPEVLSTLGCVAGKRVIELGAGIGRFTGELAKTAKHVLAMDFMQTSIDENRKANAHLGNVDFRVADVTELQLPDGCCDVIFSNWLLMYLSDAEVAALANNMLRWLAPGGIVFFRESCFRQSGDRARKANPTHYRNPREYFRIFDGAEVVAGPGRANWLELATCKCIDTYVRVKHNQNQICWKWRKTEGPSPRPDSFRAFLDTQQYSAAGILKYERVFGDGFVSTGGLQTTEELVKLLELQKGQRVLDVGCGIGGGDFYMSEQYGVHVHGVDLSVNMVLIALEKAVERHGDVTFEVADATARDFGAGAYDVVYSRDTILHVQDKPALFQQLFSFLKPGGKLLITDYCRAPGETSPEFAAYIAQRGYELHDVEAYGKMLSAAGFVDVRAEDRTWQFEQCLDRELAAAETGKDAFVADFGAEGFEEIVGGWRAKQKRVAQGEQRWGLFVATKPAQ